MNLTHHDVQEIIRLLNNSAFDELRIETDKFKLTLRRAGSGGWTQEKQTARSEAAAAVGAVEKQAAAVTLEPGMAAVHAPLVGTFYRAPKPGADPFVEVGSEVDEDTVVAVIETMKLMNSVPARARGVVAEICVDNAQFVEHGRILMKLRAA